MKLRYWILIIFSILIISILAFGPMIAKSQLESNSKEWVGRKLSIDKFKVNYFTGTITICDLKLYESDNENNFVAFDTLLIDTEPYQFAFNKVIIEEIKLIGLFTNVTANDTVFNFDDLIAFHSTPTDSINTNEIETDTIEDNDPLSIEVSNININAKSISYTDLKLDHTTELINMNITLPYLSWSTEADSEAGIEFDLADNGHFGIDFKFDPDSSDFIADISIDNLDLSKYYVYAEQALNISSLKGMFATSINVKGNLNHADQSIITGDINLDKFAIHDLEKKKLFATDNINITLGKIDNYNESYTIDSIAINKAFVNFELLKEGTNFDKLVKSSTNQDTISKTPEDTIISKESNLYYAIKSFRMNNSVVDFTDYTTPEKFEYHLSAINMSAKDINSDAEWVNTHLDMLLNNRGKMNVEFGFNPLKPMDLDVDYVLTDFLLSDINIYSEMNTGYPFNYGEMFYFSKTSIRDGIINSENNLQINDVEMGDKVKGWESIPIKFALFLLTDKNGDVKLDIPVQGDLNEPDINIKKLVWTTFKRTMIKIVSAPVDFLSGFAKVDPKDIKALEFKYQDTILNNKITKQLDQLITLENAKDGLKISMQYFNDIEKEKDQISIIESIKLFTKNTKSDYKENPDGFNNFIKLKTNKDTVILENDCRFIIGEKVIDSLYQNYSNIRITKINDYLQSKNNSTKITIEPLHKGVPKNTDSKPVFEMKYSVED